MLTVEQDTVAVKSAAAAETAPSRSPSDRTIEVIISSGHGDAAQLKDEERPGGGRRLQA